MSLKTKHLGLFALPVIALALTFSACGDAKDDRPPCPCGGDCHCQNGGEGGPEMHPPMPLYDAEGNMIEPEMDENGMPVPPAMFDEDGNAVQYYDAEGNLIEPLTDEDGNILPPPPPGEGAPGGMPPQE